MTWVLVVVATWVALSILAALVLGRALRLADRPRRTASLTRQGNFAVDVAPR